MNQSKIESFIEATINVSSGFIISLLAWMYIVIPVWDIEVSMFDNLAITALFTVISISRSYFWRRFFNRGIHRQVHNLVRSAYAK